VTAATTTAPVTVVVLDASGTASATAGVAEEISSQAIKPHLIHETVVAELAWMRSGSASTKTRSEVRGGGRKPWRQKGTGRARQGSIRAPHWTGGGIVFGPTPRSYGGKVNRKIRRQALLGALRAHLERGSVAVMDEVGWDAPSTKSAAAYLDAAPERLGDRPVAVVVSEPESAEARSFRNLRDVDVVVAADLGTVHLTSYRSLLIQKTAWEQLWGELGASGKLSGAAGPTAGEAAAAREAERRTARAARVEAKRAAAAERAALRPAEEEAPAEEPEAEEPGAKKAPAEKSPAKKAADDETTAKKAPAKKAPAKKAAEKAADEETADDAAEGEEPAAKKPARSRAKKAAPAAESAEEAATPDAQPEVEEATVAEPGATEPDAETTGDEQTDVEAAEPASDDEEGTA